MRLREQVGADARVAAAGGALGGRELSRRQAVADRRRRDLASGISRRTTGTAYVSTSLDLALDGGHLDFGGLELLVQLRDALLLTGARFTPRRFRAAPTMAPACRCSWSVPARSSRRAAPCNCGSDVLASVPWNVVSWCRHLIAGCRRWPSTRMKYRARGAILSAGIGCSMGRRSGARGRAGVIRGGSRVRGGS